MTGISRGLAGKAAAGRVSALVLYALTAVAVLLFGAFFLIGYDTPYEENPAFNDPPLTDAVLVFVSLLALGAVAVTACSVAVSIRNRNRGGSRMNNIPEDRIMWGTVALLALALALAFLSGSTEPLTVNGAEYSSPFWLRATDMFIDTVIAMLAVAVLAVAFGLTGYSRRMRLGRHAQGGTGAAHPGNGPQ